MSGTARGRKKGRARAVRKGRQLNIRCECKAPKGGLKPLTLFMAIAAAGTVTYFVTTAIQGSVFQQSSQKQDQQQRRM